MRVLLFVIFVIFLSSLRSFLRVLASTISPDYSCLRSAAPQLRERKRERREFNRSDTEALG